MAVFEALIGSVDPANAALLMAIYYRLRDRLDRVERAVEARHDVSLGD